MQFLYFIVKSKDTCKLSMDDMTKLNSYFLQKEKWGHDVGSVSVAAVFIRFQSSDQVIMASRDLMEASPLAIL
jgi:hypothetical protein